MNRHYTEIAEVVIPAHDGEESLTTLHVFDVSDEKSEDLYEIAYRKNANEYDQSAVREEIESDLCICDDRGVAPGAPFHRYEVRFSYPHTVYLWDTLAYNV